MRNAFIRLIYSLINLVFLFSTTNGNLSCSKRHERNAYLDLYTSDNKGACCWTETSKCNVACDWPEVWADLPRQI